MPVKLEGDCSNDQVQDILVEWVDGSIADRLNDTREEVFIDFHVAAVDVTQHMVGDFSTNNGSNGFSGTLGSVCYFDFVVAIVCLDVYLCMDELDLGGISSGTSLCGSFVKDAVGCDADS